MNLINEFRPHTCPGCINEEFCIKHDMECEYLITACFILSNILKDAELIKIYKTDKDIINIITAKDNKEIIYSVRDDGILGLI